MKQIILVITCLSFITASNEYPDEVRAIFKYYQDKYQIYSIEDLNKIKLNTRPNNFQPNTGRDPSQLVGDWEGQRQEMGLYITVGTDQVAPTMGSMSGFEPANGGLTITHDEFTTELNYMSIGSIFGDDQRDRNASALEFAQGYVDSAATQQGSSPFDLVEEFELSYFSYDSIVGGLGGDDPENCEINWPEDPYQMAIYSFVSEYVLNEGGSVGCFTEDSNLDLTYDYVALEMEQQWYENGGDDGQGGDGAEFMFMNFDIMNLFLIIFGMTPVGVDYPTLVMLNNEDEDIEAMALVFIPEGSYVSFDSEDISINEDTFEFTFSDLMMVDSVGATLNVDGTIGPDMYELLAGVETEIPLPSILFDSLSTEGEFYLRLNDDGTGMDMEISEIDEYYETFMDTNISYFEWSASDDSVFISYVDDDGYVLEDDNLFLSYYFNDDTLVLGQSIDPCTDPYYYYYYDSYDECFENTGIGDYAMGVYDIQDFYQEMVNHFTMMDAVEVSDESKTPSDYKLYAPYPNPFNPFTVIRYNLPEQANVNISIYDMTGRLVNSLVNGTQSAGLRTIQWNARDSKGLTAPAGVYLYKIEAGNFMDVKKMILLK